MKNSTRSTVLLGFSLLAFAGVARAQGFRWPEEPENVTALPESVKGRELGALMREFTSALGVRCEYCHAARAGEELDPRDLTSFDFASDENERKEKARAMIRMVRAINDTHLSSIGDAEVRCVTCHHGLATPERLGDVLARVIEEDGSPAAVARYRELREDHYGSAAYDFSAGTLGRLGEELMSRGELEAAIAILALENEMHPDFAYGHYLSATAHEKSGAPDAAIEHLQEAIDTASPEQKPFFVRALEELKANSRR